MTLLSRYGTTCRLTSTNFKLAGNPTFLLKIASRKKSSPKMEFSKLKLAYLSEVKFPENTLLEDECIKSCKIGFCYLWEGKEHPKLSSKGVF